MFYFKKPGTQTTTRWLVWDISLPSSQSAGFLNKVVFLGPAPCLWSIGLSCGKQSLDLVTDSGYKFPVLGFLKPIWGGHVSFWATPFSGAVSLSPGKWHQVRVEEACQSGVREVWTLVKYKGGGSRIGQESIHWRFITSSSQGASEN